MRDFLKMAQEFDDMGFNETHPLTLEEYAQIKAYVSEKMQVEYASYVDITYRAAFVAGYSLGFEKGKRESK